MFYSLVQTLVCVLLINGGLYALHLKGNTNDEPNAGESLLLPGLMNSQAQVLSNSRSAEHAQHGGGYKQSSAGAYANAGRLSEELADLAQLERERLMLLGIAKQTAAANAAAGTGHHGRAIITGRIHMSPTDDVVAEGELAGVLMPQPARGYMFGHVVKQPVQQNDGLDIGAAEFAGGGTGAGGGGGDQRSGHGNYEYGHVVKPAVVPEYDTHQMPLDLEAFMELDPEPKSDEDDFDLDSYQFLDELLAEQQQREWKQDKSHHWPNNPYQTPEEIDGGTHMGLQEFLNKEQQDSGYKYKAHQQQQQQHQHQQALDKQQKQQQHQQHQLYLAEMRNGYNPSNIRLQQKWLRKRAQQHPQRNVFDQKNHQRREESIFVQQPQPHYFNQRHHSLLSMGNSEATANYNNNKNINNNSRAKMSSTLDDGATTMNTKNHNSNQPEELQEPQQSDPHKSASSSSSSLSSLSSSSAAAAAAAEVSSKKNDDINNSKQDLKQKPQQQQQLEVEEKPQDDLILHPNHKRSGIGSSLLAPVLSAAGSHSMASQLMLRTARGQRQYDVPQIECPTAMDGMERFACPTPDLQGRYRCIDDHVLCDGFIDCPEGEDEDRRSCMFYKTTKAHLDVLADALLRWARGR